MAGEGGQSGERRTFRVGTFRRLSLKGCELRSAGGQKEGSEKKTKSRPANGRKGPTRRRKKKGGDNEAYSTVKLGEVLGEREGRKTKETTKWVVKEKGPRPTSRP